MIGGTSTEYEIEFAYDFGGPDRWETRLVEKMPDCDDTALVARLGIVSLHQVDGWQFSAADSEAIAVKLAGGPTRIMRDFCAFYRVYMAKGVSSKLAGLREAVDWIEREAAKIEADTDDSRAHGLHLASDYLKRVNEDVEWFQKRLALLD